MFFIAQQIHNMENGFIIDVIMRDKKRRKGWKKINKQSISGVQGLKNRNNERQPRERVGKKGRKKLRWILLRGVKRRNEKEKKAAREKRMPKEISRIFLFKWVLVLFTSENMNKWLIIRKQENVRSSKKVWRWWKRGSAKMIKRHFVLEFVYIER